MNILKRLVICCAIVFVTCLAHGQGTTINGPVTFVPPANGSPTTSITATAATDAFPCGVFPATPANPVICIDQNDNFTVDVGKGPVILGQQGPPGVNGTSATVAVGTVTALQSWQPPTVTNTGTANDVVLNFGIPAGPNGTNGQAATVTVGTVSTLAAGSQATVTNSGTTSAAVLNFGIPQGAAGAMPKSCAITITNWKVTRTTGTGTATFSNCH